jgi:hypothetical protein
LRKNASEHAMGAADVPGAPGWVGAERHPMLPDDENEVRAEMRVASEGGGALVESVKRSG